MTMRRVICVLFLSVFLALTVAVLCTICLYQPQVNLVSIFIWSFSQWLPVQRTANPFHKYAESIWDDCIQNEYIRPLQIQTVSVHEHDDVIAYLINEYGPDWRRRPLLLKGLWNASALNDTNRKLSITGLLEEDLVLPYFSDARLPGALTPDAAAPTRDIVGNILNGAPHKVGSQLLVQEYPHLIHEVAPNSLVTELFGDHFQPHHVLGNTAIIPGMTTVPIFMANGVVQDSEECASSSLDCDNEGRAGDQKPVTGLHSEPIANVAAQLHGTKNWTLVNPEYTFHLRPALAPDGRAFFPSFAKTLDHVPRYSVVTHAGDAIWLPTWTWHRVDYSHGVSLSASLFHFRPYEFMSRNPIFALLVVPAMIKEVLGISTQ